MEHFWASRNDAEIADEIYFWFEEPRQFTEPEPKMGKSFYFGDGFYAGELSLSMAKILLNCELERGEKRKFEVK